MTVLIAYGTIEGQTAKIARFVERVVKDFGEDAQMVDVSDLASRIEWENVDQVILAGSVHERKHPKDFEVFLAAQRKEIQARKTLFLSISLSAAFPEGQADAKDYALEMKMRTGLEPDGEMLVAGAIRAKKYDYFATQVLRHIVLRGRDYDPTVQEHEFTDWKALEAGVLSFLHKDFGHLR